MASEMPVLPEVGSRITVPGPSRPSASAALLLAWPGPEPKVPAASPQPLAQRPPQPQASTAPKLAGFAFIAQPHFQYIFAPREVIVGDVAPPPTDVQTATRNLAATV